MLRRAALAASIAIMASACANMPTPAPSRAALDHPTVVARWSADDGSLTALNVVVPPRTDVQHLRAIAGAFRRDIPTGRLIVTFFSATAGQERFVIGHMPGGDEAAAGEGSGATWLARFDVP